MRLPCAAGRAGLSCWHRAACRMSALGTLPAVQAGPSAYELSGRPEPSEPADWCNYGGMAAD